MMERIFIIMFLLLTIACNTKTEMKVVPLPQPKMVLPQVVSDDLVMNPPLEIKSFGDYLFFTQPMFGRSLLFYNKSTEQTNLWGVAGSGPNDFMSASCIYHSYDDGIIELFDTNLRKMVSFEASAEGDSITLTPKDRYRINTDSIFTLGLHKMDNGHYVSQVLMGHNDMFVLFDEEFKIHKTFGDNPIKEMPEGNHSSLYGWFASKGNKLYFACQGTGYLVCYDISGDGDAKKDWEVSFTSPSYDTEPFFSWNNENKQGFFDIQVNDEYLFLTFSGKSQKDGSVLPENILILNHKGKLVDNLMLDDDYIMAKFTVSGDNIYSFSMDQLITFDWRQAMSME